MQDFARELRATRRVLWVLVALWIVQILLNHEPSLRTPTALAEESEATMNVNIVKIAGHTVVGRKLPVDTQE